MRVLVIGGTGTIGSAVVNALSGRHEVVPVGLHQGALQVDLASPDSIAALYQSVGTCDAVISTAGFARFARMNELTEQDFFTGLKNKLMGQINVVRLGHPFLKDGGSFTVTSGAVSREPMEGSTLMSLVNAGLEGFVRAAALELPRGIRINVVSPPWVTETLIDLGMDRSIGIPAERVARAYVDSVEGKDTGKTFDPRTLPAS